MNHATVQAYIAKGYSIEDAHSLAGVPYRPEIALAESDQVATFEQLLDRAEPHAIQALLDIATNGKSESARVAAANALLDRKRGKPAQSVHVQQETTYTILCPIPAPPNSLPPIDANASDMIEVKT